MTRLVRVTVVAAIVLSACTGDGEGAGGAADGEGESVGGGAVESTVELTAPAEEGASEVPTFEWEPVEGAASYRLVVLDAEGNATWSWEGPETSVALGGVPDRPEGAEGPVLTPGSTWSVAALDAEGHVVAVSAARPVSP